MIRTRTAIRVLVLFAALASSPATGSAQPRCGRPSRSPVVTALVPVYRRREHAERLKLDAEQTKKLVAAPQKMLGRRLDHRAEGRQPGCPNKATVAEFKETLTRRATQTGQPARHANRLERAAGGGSAQPALQACNRTRRRTRSASAPSSWRSIRRLPWRSSWTKRRSSSLRAGQRAGRRFGASVYLTPEQSDREGTARRGVQGDARPAVRPAQSGPLQLR